MFDKLQTLAQTKDLDTAIDTYLEVKPTLKRFSCRAKWARFFMAISFILFFWIGIFLIFYSLSSPEEILFYKTFKTLSFIVDKFSFISNIWVALIVALLLILVGSVLVGILFGFLGGLLTINSSKEAKLLKDSSDAATRAHRLSRYFYLTVYYKFRTKAHPRKFIWSSVIATAGAVSSIIHMCFYASEKTDVGTAIGGVILGIFAGGLVHLLFRVPCAFINAVFNKKEIAVHFKSIDDNLDALWVENDPKEKKRREKEKAEQIAKEAKETQRRAESQKKQSQTSAPATSKPVTSDSSSSSPSVKNIYSWTESFVKANEDACVEKIISYQNFGLDSLREREYKDAADFFTAVVHGSMYLMTIDKNYYEPPLYAATYILARIQLFGLRNREDGRTALELACEIASNCAAPGRPTASKAMADYKTMSLMLSEVNSSKSISQISALYGNRFPNDILESN